MHSGAISGLGESTSQASLISMYGVALYSVVKHKSSLNCNRTIAWMPGFFFLPLLDVFL